MKYPKSQHLGRAHDADDRLYSLHFRGEDEGAAAITGPIAVNTGQIENIPEVHREPASDPDEARAKLRAWVDARGWRLDVASVEPVPEA